MAGGLPFWVDRIGITQSYDVTSQERNNCVCVIPPIILGNVIVNIIQTVMKITLISYYRFVIKKTTNVSSDNDELSKQVGSPRYVVEVPALHNVWSMFKRTLHNLSRMLAESDRLPMRLSPGTNMQRVFLSTCQNECSRLLPKPILFEDGICMPSLSRQNVNLQNCV